MKKFLVLKIVAIVLAAVVVVGLVVMTAVFPYIWGYAFDTGKFDISGKAQTDEITVMSFNVRGFTTEDTGKRSWFYRAKLQRSLIAEVQPDIIGFQEATDNTIWYVTHHLKGYEFLIAKTNFEENEKNMYIAYRADRFKCEAQGWFWLSETPDVPSKSWNTACVRTAAYVNLVDNLSGKRFTVCDTHLDHVSRDARTNGMQVILDKKAEFEADRFILLGDMNCSSASQAYHKAIDGGLVDASNAAESAYFGEGATYHGWGEYLDNVPIDFFFVTPNITVDEYFVFDKTYDGVYPSDHFPIVMRIKL